MHLLNRLPWTLAGALAVSACGGNLAGDGGGGNDSGPPATHTSSGDGGPEAGPSSPDTGASSTGSTTACGTGSTGTSPVPSGAACATTPTAKPTLLVPNANGSLPWGIAVDATQVFWGMQETGPAMRATLAGGTAAPLGVTSAWTVAVDATDVYTADGAGHIVSCPKSGCAGAPRIVATTQASTMGIAVDATTVYWATTGGASILSAPKAGGATTTLASGGYPYEVALDDANVYWTDNDGPIWKVAKTGGSPIKLADQTTVNSFQPMGIAVDGANVYFDTSDGKIWQVSKACGGAPLLLASDAGNEPWGLAVDEAAVYYASQQNGTVESVPIGGGCVTTLGSASGGATGVAVDATSVYFTAAAGVYAVSK
jgi:hypothetical protein